jgi:hypothetical protein
VRAILGVLSETRDSSLCPDPKDFAFRGAEGGWHIEALTPEAGDWVAANVPADAARQGAVLVIPADEMLEWVKRLNEEGFRLDIGH